jgi:hypothetical protein
MTNSFRNDMKIIQSTISEAHSICGRVLAALDIGNGGAGTASALDKMSAQFESGVISIRNLCEKHRTESADAGSKPALPSIRLTGETEVNEYGWLHIRLNSLLPHCRFQTPVWLSDTVTRLLDEYELRWRRKPPRFERAMLVIDEHCDIDSRTIYDQDNKGWKAIPNALKGRVIKDDDQFSLNIALISTKSDTPACHIYLFPTEDAGDFFFMKYENYPMFP